MRRCALVSCALLLVSCASPHEPVEPPANTPLQLRVWAEVSPARVSLRAADARLRLRLIAHNPSDTTIRIVSGGPPYVFSGDPAESSGLQQSYRIATESEPLHAGPGADYWGDSIYVFPPRHVSTVTAEVTLREWREGGWPIAPGRYVIRSYFNGREGASAAFIIVP